ncbi:MAG: aminotransferase class I/II-fold pyridoxal phosphate-dependent enzyme [Actinomycetota bacterium]
MTTDIVASIEDRSPRGIAAAISRLISDGSLPSGTRLPTVRALATGIATSPTTVAEAWQILARIGVIEARGRRGTFVLDTARPDGPRRYRRMSEGPGHFRLDLSTGTPDPALLPELGPILARVSKRPIVTSYLDDPVLPELDEQLRASWPFPPEALTVVDGAMDALDRIAAVTVRLGDRVLVEEHTFPPLLDLLDQIGAEAIGLAVDPNGIVPESLQEGLIRRPVALFLQPRAQNPTGVRMTSRRARLLAGALRGTDVIVVEDDHSGDIATGEDVSIGKYLPGQTVHIRSFSKSHGPDLRLAAIGGAGEIVRHVAARRMLGPGWSSRLLQSVLVELLRDPASVTAVGEARGTYSARRTALTTHLDQLGVRYTGSDGINLWVEVADEHAALLSLASQGVGVAAGTPFLTAPGPVDHLRVTVALLASGHAELAGQLAVAASGAAAGGRWSRHR